MPAVTVTFKDGTTRTWSADRPGGSYSPSIKYEGAFVIVTSAWGEVRAYPAADVKEVKQEAPRGGW